MDGQALTDGEAINTPKRIEYVIDFASDARRALSDTLAPYNPTYMHLVPRASVFILPQDESELVRALAEVSGITYRRGEPRRATIDSRVEPRHE